MHAHPEVQGLSEPHLVSALARLQPDAGQLPLRHQRGLHHFLSTLPQGQRTQVQATRAYLDVLYGTAMQNAPASTQRLVDKTPANARVVDFLRAVYPEAPLIILRRHPAAIAWSHAATFFSGDMERAHQERPILRETIPPLSSVIRQASESVCVVDYEQLVLEPSRQMERIWSFLGLPNCPEAIQYGHVPLDGPGDPTEVERHQQPNPDLVGRWKSMFQAHPDRRRAVEKQLSHISPADLNTWGTPLDQLWTGLAGVSPESQTRSSVYAHARGGLNWIRKDIHQRPHGRVLHKVRDFCDLLLGRPSES